MSSPISTSRVEFEGLSAQGYQSTTRVWWARIYLHTPCFQTTFMSVKYYLNLFNQVFTSLMVHTDPKNAVKKCDSQQNWMVLN